MLNPGLSVQLGVAVFVSVAAFQIFFIFETACRIASGTALVDEIMGHPYYTNITSFR